MRPARLLRSCIATCAFAVGFSSEAIAARRALVLGTTVQAGAGSREAVAAANLGFAVDVVDATTWTSMSRGDFGAYDLLILGDPNCGNVVSLQPAAQNASTWGAAVTGNIVLLLTDPDFHAAFLTAPQTLMSNAIGFAGGQPGRTGLYASLSCYYAIASPGTSVPALSGIGSFTVQGQGGCPNDVHIVDGKSPIVTNLTDADLSNWSCSAHGAFDTWPAAFTPVVIAKDIQSSYVAPDGTTGAPYILAAGSTSACARPTLPAPPDFTLDAHGWTVDFAVTPVDGFVIRNVMLGPRYMADQVSVPYFNVSTTSAAAVHGELTPDGDQAVARSRLVDFQQVTGDPVSIEATYAIDRLPAGSSSCLVVRQRYEFYSELPNGGCEASVAAQVSIGPATIPVHLPSLPCNRWKPIVAYEFTGANGEQLLSFNAPQRLFFRDDNRSPNQASLFQDEDNPLMKTVDAVRGARFELPDIIKRRDDLATEGTFVAIDHGAAGDWDNIHQSYQRIEAPQTLPVPAPGCPECVHIHWRWSAFAGAQFGNGMPIIPMTSDQSVEVAVVAWHPGEEHPYDFKSLVNNESLKGQDIVFWYSGTSDRQHDSFFTHGAFFSTFGIADLAVAVTPSARHVAPSGNTLTYTVLVTNLGPGKATNVRLTQSWSPPETFFRAAASSENCGSAGLQQVLCELGTMDVGKTVPLTLTFGAVSISGDPIVAFTQALGSQKDPDLSSNSVVTRTPIQ